MARKDAKAFFNVDSFLWGHTQMMTRRRRFTQNYKKSNFLFFIFFTLKLNFFFLKQRPKREV